MASKEEIVVSPTELVIISNDKVAEVAMGDKLMLQMKDACDKCRAIEIIDSGSLTIGQGMLTTLNKTIKAIEEKATTLGKPYHESWTRIHAVKKRLIDDAQKVVAEGKLKIVKYEEQAREEAEREKERQALEAEKNKGKIAGDAAANEKIIELISAYEKEAIDSMTGVETLADLKDKYTHYVGIIGLGQNGEDIDKQYGTMLPQAVEMRARVAAFKDTRKAAIMEIDKFKAQQGGELTAIQKKRIEAAAELQRLEAEEAAEQVRIASQVDNRKEASQAVQIVAAKEAGANADLDSAVTVKGMREVPKWELHDITKVPQAWLMVNPAKVEEWMKANKGKFAHGSIVNGILFTFERTVSL